MTTVKLIDLGDVLRRDLKEITETELTRLHAEVARQAKQEVIDEAGMEPGVETYVDGRRGASEDSVRPFGMIAYHFTYWDEVARFALETAEQLSPSLSGAYRTSWFVLVDGEVMQPETIPATAEQVFITNDQPYHRKIEVGGMTVRAPGQNGIVEKTRQAVNQRFGNSVLAQTWFINLAGPGSDWRPETPWRLRSTHRDGSGRRTSFGPVNATGRNTGNRGVINYPAVSIRPWSVVR